MKTFTIYLLFVLITGICSAQRMELQQQKAYNNYYVTINQYVKELTQTLKCLNKYHRSAETYKKPGRRFVNLKNKCACYHEITTYQKTIDESRGLPAKTARNLNKQIDSVKATYDLIMQRCRELEIYIRLEDYKSDNMKQSDALLGEIELLYRTFRTRKRELTTSIEKIYATYNPYKNKRNIKVSANIQMREALQKASDLLDLWQINMEVKTPTQSLPFDAMIQFANYLDSIEHLANYTSQLQYILKVDYRNFRGTLTGYFYSIIENALDSWTYHNRQNDAEGNYAYNTLINYYNNSMNTNYNDYITRVQKEGYTFPMYAKYCPIFKLTSQKVEYNVSATPYKKLPIPTINSKPRSETLTRHLIGALNNYIKFINREMKIYSYTYLKLTNFNRSVNRYLTSDERKYLSSFTFYDRDDYPYSIYHKALYNSKFIPIEYRNSLNNRLRTIQNIIGEKEGLLYELHQYTHKKQYENDNCQKAIEIMKRFEIILNDYNTHRTALLRDLKAVYNSYQVTDATNNWRISGEVLAELTDLSNQTLIEAKHFIKDSSGMKPSTTTLHAKVREAIMNQYKNMQGIKKIGRNHGHCPYNPYEDLPETAERLADKTDKIDTALHKIKTTYYRTKTPLDLYEDFVYIFNDVVGDYNKFAWLALGETEEGRREIKNPVYLLYRMREPLYYTYKPPAPKVIVDKNNRNDNDNKTTERDTSSGEMRGYAFNNLVLLLDISSSMNAADKFPLLKHSFIKLLDILRTQDEASIISYSGEARVALPPISCSKKDSIVSVIENLIPAGGTDAQKGLRLAYNLADENYIEKGNNRIILATDGQFKLSNKYYRIAERYAKKGIRLTVFYFGSSTRELETLKELTKAGKGNYVFITRKNMDEMLKKEVKAIKMD